MREPGSASFGEMRPAAVSDRGSIPNQRRTIGAAIGAHSEARPDLPAIVSSRFAPLSYRDLKNQIDDIGGRFRAARLSHPARLAVAFPGGAEAALAIVAVASSVAAVPLDPKLTPTEVEGYLRTLRPDGILLLGDSNPVARKVAEQLRLPAIEATLVQGGALGLRLAVPRIGPAAPRDDPDPAAPALILRI